MISNFYSILFFLVSFYTIKYTFAINQCDIIREIFSEMTGGDLDLNQFPSENMDCCNSDVIGCKELESGKLISNIEFNGEKLNIVKTIPEKITELTDLERIGITKGPEMEIPEYLASLSNLTVFEIYETKAGTKVPVVISKFKKLRTLVLSKTNFYGGIPEEYKLLTDLENIEISSNAIDQSIPDFFDSFPNLKTINLSNNMLTGNLPPSLLNLPNLQAIDVSQNRLSGLFPKDIGNLENLEELNVEKNQYHGVLPESLKELKKLKILNLSENEFNGVLDFVDQLPLLKELYLDNSGLYGSIPQLSDTVQRCSFDKTNFCSSFGQTCTTEEISECTDELLKKEEEFKNHKDEIRKKEEEDEKNKENDKSSSSLSEYILSLSLILLTLVILYGFLRYYNWYRNKKDDDILVKQIDRVNNNNPLYRSGFFSKDINSDVGSEANMLVNRTRHFSDYNNSHSLPRSIFNDSEISDNDHIDRMERIDQLEREMLQRAIDNSLRDMGPAYITNYNNNNKNNISQTNNRNNNNNSMNRMNYGILNNNNIHNSNNNVNFGGSNLRIQTNQQFKANSPLQTNIQFNNISPIYK